MKLCSPTYLRMSMNPYSRQVKSNMVNLSYTNLCPMISNLYEKVNYFLNGETLSLYLRLGMKVKRINRVLRFVQYPWLKLYIESNRHEKKDQECVQKICTNFLTMPFKKKHWRTPEKDKELNWYLQRRTKQKSSHL